MLSGRVGTRAVNAFVFHGADAPRSAMFLAAAPLSILNCDGEELAHLSFCPTWPPASIAESVRPGILR